MIEESYDFNYFDTLSLAHWLGFEKVKRFIHNFIFILIVTIFLEALIIVTKLDDISVAFCTIPIIIAIIFMVLIIFQNYTYRKIVYFKALEKYYKNFLCDYEGYQKLIVGFNNKTINKKFSNNFVLLTNGYNFILLEDPLKGTRFYFKDKTNLKVTGENEEYKLEFSAVEIKQFYLVPGLEVNAGELYNTYINIESNIKKVVVTLNDFTTIEISGNAYEYIKNSNPLKEVDYEIQ